MRVSYYIENGICQNTLASHRQLLHGQNLQKISKWSIINNIFWWQTSFKAILYPKIIEHTYFGWFRSLHLFISIMPSADRKRFPNTFEFQGSFPSWDLWTNLSFCKWKRKCFISLTRFLNACQPRFHLAPIKNKTKQRQCESV